jgi:two-component system sensor histidine kinase KdpD
VAEVLAGTAHVLVPGTSGALEVLSACPSDAALDAKELGVARWTFEHARMAGLGTDTLPGSKTTCAPLALGGRTLGVLALERAAHEPLQLEQRELLEAFGRQAAFALERARLESEARAAALRAKTEELRASLLGAVSHDLRTPLAAITGAGTALRDQSALPAETRAELLDTICEEAERLERLVSNLLDMTRLETGVAELEREWVPLDELIGSALGRLEKKLTGREVRVELPGELPLLSVDPVLFPQVLVNLLENAAKYTPATSPLEIAGSREADTVAIEVRDRGPGLPPGAEERVFEKFYRGGQAGGGGVGLGLPICRAIVSVHGGSIHAQARPGGGTVFRIVLPLDVRAPSSAPAAEAP